MLGCLDFRTLPIPSERILAREKSRRRYPFRGQVSNLLLKGRRDWSPIHESDTLFLLFRLEACGGIGTSIFSTAGLVADASSPRGTDHPTALLCPQPELGLGQRTVCRPFLFHL